MPTILRSTGTGKDSDGSTTIVPALSRNGSLPHVRRTKAACSSSKVAGRAPVVTVGRSRRAILPARAPAHVSVPRRRRRLASRPSGTEPGAGHGVRRADATGLYLLYLHGRYGPLPGARRPRRAPGLVTGRPGRGAGASPGPGWRSSRGGAGARRPRAAPSWSRSRPGWRAPRRPWRRSAPRPGSRRNPWWSAPQGARRTTGSPAGRRPPRWPRRTASGTRGPAPWRPGGPRGGRDAARVVEQRLKAELPGQVGELVHHLLQPHRHRAHGHPRTVSADRSIGTRTRLPHSTHDPS